MTTTDYDVDEVKAEVLTGSETLTSGALAQLNASEIDRQVATARAYPRQLSRVRREIFSLVVQDEETASSMIYALPRGREKNEATGRWEQKIVKGPTARFAEIMAYGWGNNRCGARIIDEGAEFLTAQGVFFDLEKNISWSVEVKRRITDKEGKRYNADMIAMTANAALSIAGRNAILKAIPKAWWKGLYEAAEQTIRGDIKTLSERRQKALEQFKAYGMTPSMVCQVLGVGGSTEISLDHISALHGILTALRDGETTVEQLMSDAGGASAAVAEKGKQRMEEVKRKYSPPSSGVNPEVQQVQAKLQEKRAKAAGPPSVTEPLENLDAEPVETTEQGPLAAKREQGW